MVAPGVSQAGRTALAPSVWVGGSGHSLSVLSYYRATTPQTDRATERQLGGMEGEMGPLSPELHSQTQQTEKRIKLK